MKTIAIKKNSILAHFIKAPDLKINSENYPFENFEFSDENVDESDFNFPKDYILGMQAEACFEAYFKRSKNFGLLVANLQIHGVKETLGELDYIVENLKTKKIVHIELACKFYLYDENAGDSEEQKWVGPNRKDSLFDKLEKVKLKQFPLLHTAETIQKLTELGIAKPSSQELCLKAFLFIPKKMDAEIFPKPFQNCIIGHFIKPTDLKEDETALYAIPNKKEWLLPAKTLTNWHNFSEIKQLIDLQIKKNKSPLIYKKTPHTMERFFIVWW
ncbi:DUF1853 family protein [Aequorivita antarctica]|nr:DUF1853 family protein [Aequorivita antarctica]